MTGLVGGEPNADALLEAAHRGDPVALDRLLARSEPIIRRYALRHCVFQVVDDAVQDSLLVLARKLSTVRALRAFSGWLFQVVRRECHRLGRTVLRADPWDYETTEAILVRSAEEGLRARVIAGLESLPEHYRDVVVLRDLEELGISEIAARLGESPGAVKSRLHRARELLREYLTS